MLPRRSQASGKRARGTAEKAIWNLRATRLNHTCRGVDVIVGTVRQQVLGLEVFSVFGIDPTKRQLLVAK